MKRLINITIELSDISIPQFEEWLRRQVNVIGFTILPDTKKMYDENVSFRTLVKLEKDAKKAKTIFINDNNQKYI